MALLDTRQRFDWQHGMHWCDPDEMGVLPWLWSWCRDLESWAYALRDDLCDEVPDAPTIGNLCSWLLADGFLEWCEETLQVWSEFSPQLRRVIGRVREAVAVVTRPEVLVRCAECGEPLSAVGDGLWECPSAHTVSIKPVGLREAARLVGVKKTTLERWLTAAGVARLEEATNRKLYDLGEVRRVVSRRHALQA